MLRLDPTPICVLRRMQAPPADLFSIHAGTVCKAPFSSFQDASTRIFTAVRGSGMAPLIPELSARDEISSGGLSVIGGCEASASERIGDYRASALGLAIPFSSFPSILRGKSMALYSAATRMTRETIYIHTSSATATPSEP